MSFVRRASAASGPAGSDLGAAAAICAGGSVLRTGAAAGCCAGFVSGLVDLRAPPGRAIDPCSLACGLVAAGSVCGAATAEAGGLSVFLVARSPAAADVD